VALTDDGVDGDADHDVGEVAARRLAHAQAPEVDGRTDVVDRAACRILCFSRHAIHEHVDVASHEPHCREEYERCDEQRGDRVGLHVAGAHEDEADEHGDGAGEVACEMQRVRRERRAPVCAGCARRRERASDVDDENDADYDERPPRRMHGGVRRAGEAHDRAPDDQEACEHEDRGLSERREVLCLAVPVLVAGVGRPDGDADREEGQQRGDQVGARVHCLGDEPEAAGGEARAELQPDQGQRGEDGEERGAARRGH